MGRREEPVPDGPLREFALGLRELRAGAPGRPTYRDLARVTNYAVSTLSDAAAGRRLPTLAVTRVYVRACGGDVAEWEARWQELHERLHATHPELIQPNEAVGSAGEQSATPPDAVPDGHAGPRANGDASSNRWTISSLSRDDPARIGPYRLLGRLGSGSMGQVFLGISKAGRPAAVKVIRPDLAGDTVFRRRFATEVAVARQVHGPYTPAVIDAELDTGQLWLATTYIAGPSVAEIVGENGRLAAVVVRGVTAGIAEALAAIHAAGVVHRDLKPSNVLLDADGPKVIDFGIARAADATQLTQAGQTIGSVPFISPEQAEGRPATAASDIFSLGGLMAYMATGVLPFGEGSPADVLYRVVHADPDPAALACPDDILRALITACLNKDPSQRPTPAQIIDACTREHQHEDWLPAALAAQIARRDTELSAVLAKAARHRTIVRVRLGALPMLLALAITLFVVFGNDNGGSTPVTTGPAPRNTMTAPVPLLPPTTAVSPSPSYSSSPATVVTALPPPQTTPRSSNGPVNAPLGGAPRLLGTPDFDGYCRATGQGGAHLGATNAYGWRCQDANSAGDDAEAVCAWTYQTTPDQVTNRVTNFNDPNSWQCWHATRELGALDFNAYCQDIGYPSAYYITGRDAYGWYCTNDPDAIDTQDACLKLYGGNPPISRFQDFYDQNSWQCWGS